MRKLLIIFLCSVSVFLFCSCGQIEREQSREAVVINLPEDDSVNGYRTQKPDYSDNTVINADSVIIDKSPNKTQSKTEGSKSNGTYCANKNTGVFHKSDCSSVAKMKEENKRYFDDRQLSVSEGYKACAKCKP